VPLPTTERQPLPASSALDEWFVSEVLPLEGLLVAVIRRHWREADEVADLRQEVFARVYESAAVRRPECAQAFVITTARNLLIDRARRSQVVSFETVADLETLDLPSN
jgi:DNA-directed RNA polymerase specialized sigma24 family protein